MTTDTPKWWQNWIVYVLAALLALLGPYVGGYFLLGNRVDYPHVIERHFSFKYGQAVFSPLARVEALMSDGDVTIYGTNGYMSWVTD